jgi:hypothetical protein
VPGFVHGQRLDVDVGVVGEHVARRPAGVLGGGGGVVVGDRAASFRSVTT